MGCSAKDTAYTYQHPYRQMRYFVQFAIPALIFIAVLFVVSRKRRHVAHEEDEGSSMFLVILVVGADAAVATIFALQA